MPTLHKKKPVAKHAPAKSAQAKIMSSAVVNNPYARSSRVEFVRDVCSVTNPFCPEAIGARWPDNSYTKSVGWSITDRQMSLGADAAGTAGVVFAGDLGAAYTLGSFSGATATWSANWSQLTAMPSNSVRYRLTSWGIKVSSNLSKFTAAGMVRVRLFSPISGATLGTSSINSNMADFAMDIPLSRVIEKDLFIVPAALGDNARFFRANESYTSTVANWQNPGWQIVQIAAEGAPASVNVLNLSIFYNFELVFADGDASNAFAQPPPKPQPGVIKAVAGIVPMIGNAITGTAETVDRLYNTRVGQFVANNLANYFLGPGGTLARGTALAIRDVN